jgi:ribosome assembly protein YihI (activator of Der GTPase)
MDETEELDRMEERVDFLIAASDNGGSVGISILPFVKKIICRVRVLKEQLETSQDLCAMQEARIEDLEGR